MPKTFYIIDGHAQIYRAYFAPFRDLTSASGEPTKATYVFTQMLLNLIDQRKPDYLAMVIDSGDETVFRTRNLPGVQGQSPEPPGRFSSRRNSGSCGSCGMPACRSLPSRGSRPTT